MTQETKSRKQQAGALVALAVFALLLVVSSIGGVAWGSITGG